MKNSFEIIDNNLNNIIKKRIDEFYKSKSTTLDLSNLKMRKLPKNIPNNVKYLFINNNKLSTIDELKNLNNLIVLDCSYNKLTNLYNLPDTYELNCRNNLLRNISYLKKSIKIEKLDCSFNNIDKIPIIKNLKIIHCNNNKLFSLPELPSINKINCVFDYSTN